MPRGSRPGERRGGRKRGTPNKDTAELRDMILGALDGVGGVDYLKARALDTPASFLTLIGKVLPQNVNANVSFDLAGAVAEAEERLRARGISV